MSRLRLVSVLVSGGLLMAGCSALSGQSDAVSSQVKPVGSLAHCGLTAPGLVLVENAEQWQKLSSGLGASLPAWPDDPEHWLIVASLGQQRTGGYGLDFVNVEMAGEQLRIDVKVRRPAADALVTQALTTPCLVVELPSTGWQTVTVDGDAPFPMSREHP